MRLPVQHSLSPNTNTTRSNHYFKNDDSKRNDKNNRFNEIKTIVNEIAHETKLSSLKPNQSQKNVSTDSSSKYQHINNGYSQENLKLRTYVQYHVHDTNIEQKHPQHYFTQERDERIESNSSNITRDELSLTPSTSIQFNNNEHDRRKQYQLVSKRDEKGDDKHNQTSAISKAKVIYSRGGRRTINKSKYLPENDSVCNSEDNKTPQNHPAFKGQTSPIHENYSLSDNPTIYQKKISKPPRMREESSSENVERYKTMTFNTRGNLSSENHLENRFSITTKNQEQHESEDCNQQQSKINLGMNISNVDSSNILSSTEGHSTSKKSTIPKCSLSQKVLRDIRSQCFKLKKVHKKSMRKTGKILKEVVNHSRVALSSSATALTKKIDNGLRKEHATVQASKQSDQPKYNDTHKINKSDKLQWHPPSISLHGTDNTSKHHTQPTWTSLDSEHVSSMEEVGHQTISQVRSTHIPKSSLSCDVLNDIKSSNSRKKLKGKKGINRVKQMITWISSKKVGKEEKKMKISQSYASTDKTKFSYSDSLSQTDNIRIPKSSLSNMVLTDIRSEKGRKVLKKSTQGEKKSAIFGKKGKNDNDKLSNLAGYVQEAEEEVDKSKEIRKYGDESKLKQFENDSFQFNEHNYHSCANESNISNGNQRKTALVRGTNENQFVSHTIYEKEVERRHNNTKGGNSKRKDDEGTNENNYSPCNESRKSNENVCSMLSNLPQENLYSSHNKNDSLQEQSYLAQSRRSNENMGLMKSKTEYNSHEQLNNSPQDDPFSLYSNTKSLREQSYLFQSGIGVTLQKSRDDRPSSKKYEPSVDRNNDQYNNIQYKPGIQETRVLRENDGVGYQCVLAASIKQRVDKYGDEKSSSKKDKVAIDKKNDQIHDTKQKPKCQEIRKSDSVGNQCGLSGTCANGKSSSKKNEPIADKEDGQNQDNKYKPKSQEVRQSVSSDNVGYHRGPSASNEQRPKYEIHASTRESKEVGKVLSSSLGKDVLSEIRSKPSLKKNKSLETSILNLHEDKNDSNKESLKIVQTISKKMKTPNNKTRQKRKVPPPPPPPPLPPRPTQINSHISNILKITEPIGNSEDGCEGTRKENTQASILDHNDIKYESLGLPPLPRSLPPPPPPPATSLVQVQSSSNVFKESRNDESKIKRKFQEPQNNYNITEMNSSRPPVFSAVLNDIRSYSSKELTKVDIATSKTEINSGSTLGMSVLSAISAGEFKLKKAAPKEKPVEKVTLLTEIRKGMKLKAVLLDKKHDTVTEVTKANEDKSNLNGILARRQLFVEQGRMMSSASNSDWE